MSSWLVLNGLKKCDGLLELPMPSWHSDIYVDVNSESASSRELPVVTGHNEEPPLQRIGKFNHQILNRLPTQWVFQAIAVAELGRASYVYGRLSSSCAPYQAVVQSFCHFLVPIMVPIIKRV